MTETTEKIAPAIPESTPKPTLKNSAAATIEQEVLDSEQHIESWFHDLLASLPHLRETATYNHLRAAIDDLKKRFT